MSSSAESTPPTFTLGSDFPYQALAQPAAIGPYRLLEKLGEGGMGIVYKAEQRSPVRRIVALKLIKIGMDTREVIARFESERQALALMSHPNIAAVLDAGATETGRPYFVMEYVPGEPITAYCDRNHLTLRDRLELFTQACEAVGHAHQKAIIHRDIKPSNVLVMLADDKPIVKVIDFGVAKATNQRLTEHTVFTERGQLIGTPEYMSPEQAEMSGIDVDTRSDIYSLGVVLYELLAGVLPFDSKTLRSAAFNEIQRIIRDVDPPRPSTRLSTLGAGAAEIAKRRQTQIEALQRQLRGELEWIPLKALRKDPQQRYRTVSEMAEDIANYLAHRPLIAGPLSARYQMRKFLRRNKGLVASVAAVIVVLVAGIIGTTIGFVRAERQRRDAVAARDSAQAVNDFLTKDVIGSADPGITRGRELSVREALDNAAKSIATKFTAHPLTEASVRMSVALAYQSVGRAEVGLPHAQAAYETRRRLLGDDHPDTLHAKHVLAYIFQSLAKMSEAERLYDEVIVSRTRVLGADHEHTIESIHNLASIYQAQGRLADAERLLKGLLEKRRVTPGLDDPGTLATVGALGLVLREQGKQAEAEPLLRDALARLRRVRGADHPETLVVLSNLAGLVHEQGKPAGAEPLYREAVETSRRVLGPDHPDTLLKANSYCGVLTELGKLAEAEALARDAVERARRTSTNDGADHVTPFAINNLATILQHQGKVAEAEPLFREALEIYRRMHGADHGATVSLTNNLASLLQAQGRFGEAEPLMRAAYESSRKTSGADHPDTLVFANNLGFCLNAQGKSAEAETILRDTLERARRVLGNDHARTVSCANALAVTLKELGKLVEAEQLSREVVATFRRTLGPEHPSTLLTMNNLAKLLEVQRKPAEAEPLFREALAGMRKQFGDDHAMTLRVAQGLAMFLMDQQRHAEAEPLAADLYARVPKSQVPPRDSAIAVALYGPCLVKVGKLEAADAPLREGYRRLRETDQTRTRLMRDVVSGLIDVCDRAGRTGEAEKFRAELAALMAATQPATAPSPG